MTFTPIEATVGGLVLGIAVFWNARLLGRVTGISGAFYSSLMGDSFSLAFITGLISGGIALKRVFNDALTNDPLENVPLDRILIAAWFVGVGTSLANGCTSGHGVCGLARLSPRSLVAVIVFFATALQTATFFNTSGFFTPSKISIPQSISDLNLPESQRMVATAVVIIASLVLPYLLRRFAQSLKEDKTRLLRELILYVIGLTFACGLLISEMANPAKTIGFLDLGGGNWDPSLPFVFLGVLPLAYFGFAALRRGSQPALVAAHSLPTTMDIDFKLVSGSVVFGLGWGLLGLCPGPALVYFGAFPFNYKAPLFVLSMAGGSVLSKALDRGYDKWVS